MLKASLKMVDVLIVTYGGGHVALIVPIARRLIELGYNVLIIAATTAAKSLEREGLKFVRFLDFHQAGSIDVQNWGTELLQTTSTNNLVDDEESIAYLGLNFKELVGKYGEKEAKELYAKHGRQAFLPVELFKTWLSYINPQLVMTTNSPRSERAAILAAGALNIPSICCVDLFCIDEIAWIGAPKYADKVCVLDGEVRELLLSHGRGEEEVIVTGNPAFDRLFSQEAERMGSLLRIQHDPTRRLKTILFASQVEPHAHPFNPNIYGDPSLPLNIEDTLKAFVSETEGFQLIVRPHPSETRILPKNEEKIKYLPTNIPIENLLHAVDIVVIMTSTVGLQAHLLGKPVIVVAKSIFSRAMHFKNRDGIIEIAELSDIPSAVISAASLKSSAKQCSAATEKVVDQAIQLMQKRFLSNT